MTDWKRIGEGTKMQRKRHARNAALTSPGRDRALPVGAAGVTAVTAVTGATVVTVESDGAVMTAVSDQIDVTAVSDKLPSRRIVTRTVHTVIDAPVLTRTLEKDVLHQGRTGEDALEPHLQAST